MGVWKEMIKHTFAVQLQIEAGGYEKYVTLVGEARTEDEAVTMALLQECHNELHEDEKEEGQFIDDIFTYTVCNVAQVSYDEYQTLAKYTGGW